MNPFVLAVGQQSTRHFMWNWCVKMVTNSRRRLRFQLVADVKMVVRKLIPRRLLWRVVIKYVSIINVLIHDCSFFIFIILLQINVWIHNLFFFFVSPSIYKCIKRYLALNCRKRKVSDSRKNLCFRYTVGVKVEHFCALWELEKIQSTGYPEL